MFPHSPRASPLQAHFDAWSAHQQQVGRLRQQASVKVYRAMWQALAEWCLQQSGKLALQALDGPLLRRYLDSRSGMAGPGEALTVRYRLRLLSLVHWVQAHDLSRHDLLGAAGAPGSAAPHRRSAAARAWSAASLAAGPAVSMAAPDAPGSLGASMTGPLITWLLGPATAASAGRWQDLRDRCALALQLGAGIGPGDLRALRLADVLAPASRPVNQAGPPASVPAGQGNAGWCLRVPANGNAPTYQAPVAAWAAGLLRQWLAGRAQWGLAGEVLFPSTRSGKPWGKVAQYGSVRKVLANAGLPDGPGGSFRLRHTFALRQLVHGHAADTVAGWLGVCDPNVMQRYRQALGTALIDHAAHGAHAGPADHTGALTPWPV